MKKANASDFSQGSIPRNVLRLAIPIIAAEFVHILYNLVDRMYIGHIDAVGTTALTGIGIVLPLITATSAFANIASTGGSSLCAIARGEGNIKKATDIQTTSFTLLLVTGCVLTLIFALFKKPLLMLLGADEETLPFALDYFRIYLCGTVFSVISLGMNSFINMQGFPGIGMGTVILGAASNILLDPLFIFTLGMGVRGAALATVLSQMLSFAWVLRFFFGKKAIIRIQRLYIRKTHLRHILSLGVTGFVFKITNSITQAVVNITLKAWGGALSTLYIGAMSVINSLREAAHLPGAGISDAAKPVMSFNYGAKKYDRVRETIRFMTVLNLCVNVFFYLLYHLCPRMLIGIFSSDAELIALCEPCLHYFFAAFFMMTFQNCGQAVFVSLNMPKFAVFFALLRKMFLILPLTILLPYCGLGAEGVFWAETASEVISGTACYITMLIQMKRHVLPREELSLRS